MGASADMAAQEGQEEVGYTKHMRCVIDAMVIFSCDYKHARA